MSAIAALSSVAERLVSALSPRAASPPSDVWTFNLFTLLAAVQTQLVDPANTFNMPLAARQNIKLRVLLQESPEGGVWTRFRTIS